MIAITGIGIVSPIGTGKESVMRSLSASASGISSSERFKTHESGITCFGEVRDFVPKQFIPPMKARRMSRFSQFALASAVEAMEDSGVKIGNDDSFSVGIASGTGLASTDSTDAFYEGVLRGGPEGTNPMVFPETVQNIAASHISMHFGIKGPSITFSHADISSELALFYGCELLKDGQIDIVLVTGSEELSPSAVTGYSSLRLLSEEMMPFDIRRNGFVLAEGGASLVLERLKDAQNRGAAIYCTCSAPAISSCPSPTLKYDTSRRSMERAMKTALHYSGLEYPDLISASANSSQDLDMLEAETIREVFGFKSGYIPVTALRSFYGFFQGDGILRTAITALCLKKGILPATLGLQTPPPDYNLDFVKDSPRNAFIHSALVNSFSSGGSAASIVLRNS